MAQKPTSNEQRRYQQMVKSAEPKPARLRNAILAFVGGGTVCLLGEWLTDLYEKLLHVSHQKAADPAVATLIFLGALLTGLGVFDNLALYLGMGLGVPVTGFANSMVSPALEFKREGFVTGVGAKLFSMAGAVITFGVVTAFFVGLVHAIFVHPMQLPMGQGGGGTP